MRGIVYFLVGMLILILTLAAVVLGGLMFDVAGDARVNGYIFQPNNLAAMRVGMPLPLDAVSEKFVRERLIKRFVSEYFSVLPDPDDVVRREQQSGVMAAMAANDVFNEWRASVVPDLTNLAGRRALRRVRVNDILKMDEYWAVGYELITWEYPNLMGAGPVSVRGVMYLQLDYETGIRDEINLAPFDATAYLTRGGDPAVIFKFKVTKVVK